MVLPHIHDYMMVSGNQTRAIRIAAHEDAIVLIYRTRSYGEEWQEVGAVHHEADGLWRPAPPVRMHWMGKGLPG